MKREKGKSFKSFINYAGEACFLFIKEYVRYSFKDIYQIFIPFDVDFSAVLYPYTFFCQQQRITH